LSLASRARQRFYGWWVVSVTAVLYGYGAGVNFYGFGVFFNPMREEFGWSRAATAGVFSLSRLEGAPLGPIIGWLIDRIGSRRMMVAGLAITGLGFMTMYFIQSLWMFYLIYGLLIATGFSMGFFQASQAVVANWFLRRRARALSYLAVGGGLGGAILVPAMGAFMGMGRGHPDVGSGDSVGPGPKEPAGGDGAGPGWPAQSGRGPGRGGPAALSLGAGGAG
jgi:MFS family permease